MRSNDVKQVDDTTQTLPKPLSEHVITNVPDLNTSSGISNPTLVTALKDLENPGTSQKIKKYRAETLITRPLFYNLTEEERCLVLDKIEKFTVPLSFFVALLINAQISHTDHSANQTTSRLSESVIAKIVSRLESPFTKKIDTEPAKDLIKNMERLISKPNEHLESYAIFDKSVLVALMRNQHGILRLANVVNYVKISNELKTHLLRTFCAISFIDRNQGHLIESKHYPEPKIVISPNTLAEVSRILSGHVTQSGIIDSFFKTDASLTSDSLTFPAPRTIQIRALMNSVKSSLGIKPVR